jgi:D-alanine-D-alanine ligase
VRWEKGTQAYEVTRSAAAKDLEEETRKRLQETAVQVYSALQLRDYGRVDMRLTRDGHIYVIEANPNPWLAPEAELAIAAGLAGRSYVELIGQIVELALARYAA